MASGVGKFSSNDVVTLAVVTYNSAADLPAFFSELRRAMPHGIELRVVVADNASTDRTPDLVTAQYAEAQVIRLERNGGYAAGINAILARWTGDGPVLVLNPHVRLEPQCLEELLSALDDPGIGIAVPRLVDESGATRLSLRREPSVARAWGEALLGGTRSRRHAALGEVVADPARYEQGHTVDWATGAAMLISPDCLRAVPSWTTSYFMYSEETDYALRCRDAGFSVQYVPTAVAHHRDAGSTESPDLWSRLTLSRIDQFRSRHGRIKTALFTAGVVTNEGLRAAAGSEKHKSSLRVLLRRTERRDLAQRLAASSVQACHDPSPGPDVICFSAQDWWYHNRAHSDFQLMQRIAGERKVLFVNSIGMRMPLPGRSTQPWRRIARKAASIARFHSTPLAHMSNFHVLSPLILPFYGVPAVRALNTRLVAWQVEAISRRLGITQPVCVATIPTAWPVAQRLDVRGLVYNRSDKHSEFEETDQDYIRRLELDLLRGADRVAYVSRALMAAEAPETADRARFLDHGVDLELFRPTPEQDAAAMSTIPRPRIGFFGGFDDYVVDMGLLERVAKAIPEAQIVLIGDATCPMEQLTSRPNVHWLGFRPHDEIPSLGSGFDVALMPWLRNGWIEACNPIKLKEYLALGLPVVSTDFPEVRHYDTWIRIAQDEESFIELVRLTLQDGGLGTPQSRRAAVATASWGQRAQDLLTICDEIGRHD